jgi:hypothetical protein
MAADIITASRFNLLQKRLSSILGSGNAQSGYGQGISGYGGRVSSSEVSILNESNRNIATAENINELYTDILRARIHQIGYENEEITNTVRNARLKPNLNLIADETSNFFSDLAVESEDPDGELLGMRDFERMMSLVERDKFLVHDSMAVEETGESFFRVRPWDFKLTHEVRVRFRNANHRRHFFNSGGQLQISALLNNPAGNKSLDWAQTLSLAGTIKFGYNYCESTSTDTTSPPTILSGIGNYQLSNQYDVYTGTNLIGPLFVKQSRGEYDEGRYIGNNFTISAKEINASEIQFRMVYDDVSADSFQYVQGTMRSFVNHYRSKGTFASENDIYLNVEVPAPYYENITTF